jgi:hypothetical protein
VQWRAPKLPVQFRYDGSDWADFLRRCEVLPFFNLASTDGGGLFFAVVRAPPGIGAAAVA